MAKKRTRLPSLSTLESVKEALDVLLGRRGEKLDKVVTFRDLEESGAFNAVFRGGDLSLTPKSNPSTGEGSDGIDLDTWVPPGPKGLEATSMFGGVFIEWDTFVRTDAIAYVEVFRADSNDASQRKLLTSGMMTSYFDQIGDGDTNEYFYWVRYRSEGNKVGPFTGPASAAAQEKVEYIIDRLEGEILQSHLADELSKKIDVIEPLENWVGELEAGVYQEIKELQDEDKSLRSTITTNVAKLDDAVSAVRTTITSEVKRLGDRITATSNKIDSVQSSLSGALSSAVSRLGSSISSVDGRLTSTANALLKAQSQLSGALSTAQQSLQSKIDVVDGKISGVTELITQVQTTVNGKLAGVRQDMTTAINGVTGKVTSMYTLRINSNGRVSGFGLSDDGRESVFGVEADRFYIGGSWNTDSRDNRYPFIVNRGRVYMRSALIQNASIDNAKIANGAITNAKIANASINSAKISNGSITNAKIGNFIRSNNYVAGVRGWNLDKFGNAEFNDATFRGTVYANKIEGAINKTQAANWYGYTTLPARSSRNRRITVFAVRMPNNKTEYRPFFCFTATGTTSSSTGVDIRVDVWVDHSKKKSFDSFAMGYTGMGVTVSGSTNDTYPGGSYFEFTVDMGSYEGGTVVRRIDGYFGGLA
mgnify:CR=1 FL=1